MARFIPFLVLVLVLSACSTSPVDTAKRKAEARAAADRFLLSLQAGTYDIAYDQLSASDKSAMSKTDFVVLMHQAAGSLIPQFTLETYIVGDTVREVGRDTFVVDYRLEVPDGEAITKITGDYFESLERVKTYGSVPRKPDTLSLARVIFNGDTPSIHIGLKNIHVYDSLRQAKRSDVYKNIRVTPKALYRIEGRYGPVVYLEVDVKNNTNRDIEGVDFWYETEGDKYGDMPGEYASETIHISPGSHKQVRVMLSSTSANEDFGLAPNKDSMPVAKLRVHVKSVTWKGDGPWGEKWLFDHEAYQKQTGADPDMWREIKQHAENGPFIKDVRPKPNAVNTGI